MAMTDTTITATSTANVHEPGQAEDNNVKKVEAKSAKAREGKVSATGTPALVKAEAKRSTTTADDKPAKQKAAASRQTKTQIVLKKLHSAKGVTITQLGQTTGWQAHSVRGFLSAVVKKKLGLMLVSEVGKDGARRYRVEDDGSAAR